MRPTGESSPGRDSRLKPWLGNPRTGWTRVSRQFLLILAVTFLVIVLLVTLLTYRHVRLSEQADRLARNLQNTFELNQELRIGIQEQIAMLHRQFEQPNPQFPILFTRQNYDFGEKQSRYRSLDIGDRERLTVESVIALQAELGVQALQIFEQLRRGERDEALQRVVRVEQLGEKLDREFELLNRVQVEKLQAVLAGVRSSSERAQIATASLAGSLLLVLGVVTMLLRRRVLQPLQQLARVSEEIRNGNFSARLPAGREDELGQVSRSFNFMAESLEQSYATLEGEVRAREHQLRDLQSEVVRMESTKAWSRMVRGAAYELNNPLTAITGFVELQKRRVLATRRDADELRTLQDILSQTERCRRIVSNLLQMTRPAAPEGVAMGINAVVEPVVQLREYEMKISNVRLVRDYSEEDPTVRTDPQLLRQLILTCVSAADTAARARFSPASLTVQTRKEKDRVLVRIWGDGPAGRTVPNGCGATEDVPFDATTVSSFSALANALGEGVSTATGPDVCVTVSLPAAGGAGRRETDNLNGTLSK